MSVRRGCRSRVGLAVLLWAAVACSATAQHTGTNRPSHTVEAVQARSVPPTGPPARSPGASEVATVVALEMQTEGCRYNPVYSCHTTIDDAPQCGKLFAALASAETNERVFCHSSSPQNVLYASARTGALGISMTAACGLTPSNLTCINADGTDGGTVTQAHLWQYMNWAYSSRVVTAGCPKSPVQVAAVADIVCLGLLEAASANTAVVGRSARAAAELERVQRRPSGQPGAAAKLVGRQDASAGGVDVDSTRGAPVPLGSGPPLVSISHWAHQCNSPFTCTSNVMMAPACGTLYSTLVTSGATTFCTATSSTSKTSLSVSAVANVLSLSYFKSCACPTQNGVLDVTCANGGVVPAQYLWQLNMWAAYNRGCPSNQFVLGAVANSICEAVSSAMGATSAPKPDAHAPLPPPLTATLLGGHGGDASTAGGAPGGSELTDVVSLYFWSQICKRSAQTCYSSTKLTPECGKLATMLEDGDMKFCSSNLNGAQATVTASVQAGVLSLTYWSFNACSPPKNVNNATCGNGAQVPASALVPISQWSYANKGCPTDAISAAYTFDDLCLSLLR